MSPEQVDLQNYAKKTAINVFTEKNTFEDVYLNLTPAQIDAIQSLKLIVNKEWVLSKIPNANCKIYRAIISQISTDDPIATDFENTLGGELVWTRTGVGTYIGTLIGAFPIGKVFMQSSTSGNAGATYPVIIVVNRNTDDSVFLVVTKTDSVSTKVDSRISNTPIEIRVYN